MDRGGWLSDSYGVRWVKHALEATKAFFGVHLGALILAVLGPAVGFLALSVLTGSNDLPEAIVELKWLLYGTIGTVAVLALAFLGQLLLAPAGLERQERERGHARELTLQGHAARQAAEQTRQLASGRDTISALQTRLEASRIAIEISHVGGPLSAVDISGPPRDSFIEGERTRYQEAFRRWAAEEGAAKASYPYPSADILSRRDQRTAEEFTAEVGRYLNALRSSWLNYVRRATIRQRVAPLKAVVTNPGETAFGSVVLELYLPVDIGAGWDDDPLWRDSLPDPPDEWGTQTIYSSLRGFQVPASHPPADPGSIERVGEMLVVAFSPFDMRPRARVPLPAIYVFIPSTHAASLDVRWTAASADRNLIGRAEGRLSIVVAEQASQPGPLLDATRDL